MTKIFIFFILTTLLSCGGSSAPNIDGAISEDSLTEKQLAFLKELDGLNGESDTYIYKTDTEQDGEWIIVRTITTTGSSSYRAYDLRYYEQGKWIENYQQWSNSDPDSHPLGNWANANIANGENMYEVVRGTNWCNVTNTCTIYKFEDQAASNKDLEKLGSRVEAMEVAKIEETLIDYGLSNEKSFKLGSLINSYSKIKTKRSLTSREKDVFTKELTGLKFKEASEMLVNDGYDALIEKAAMINEADPEAIKELINQIL